MSELINYEPQSVFYYFDKITKIPRPSYSEGEICKYLIQFAKDHDLKYYADEHNNVIIIKNATEGYEDKDAVILQAHLDMVCVKDADVEIDFEKDGIDVYIEGDYITARGTSLGADDGIGIAMILALLDSKTAEHPKLEAVFTSAEEVGLDGAKAIDKSLITGKRLINIDSEEDYNLVIGCAGGCRSDTTFNFETKKKTGNLLEISIEGLTGGHSGVEIHKSGANAISLMGRLLFELSEEFGVRLVSMSGGEKENAICVRTNAVIMVDDEHKDAVISRINHIENIFVKNYKETDPALRIVVSEKGVKKAKVLKKKELKRLLHFIGNTPGGVIKRHKRDLSMIEVSCNHGIIEVSEGTANVCISLRSGIDSELDWLKKKLTLIADVSGGLIEFKGEYPAWESKGMTDFVLHTATKYKQLFGEEINICTIHAGLECALFCSDNKELEAISIGPTMYGVHTTEEKLLIPSVLRVWKLLLEIIKG